MIIQGKGPPTWGLVDIPGFHSTTMNLIIEIIWNDTEKKVLFLFLFYFVCVCVKRWQITLLNQPESQWITNQKTKPINTSEVHSQLVTPKSTPFCLMSPEIWTGNSTKLYCSTTSPQNYLCPSFNYNVSTT